MCGIVRTVILLASIVLIPTAALAQAVIAGTVKDPSGAVLPGVTVEATSPVLIEKVRTAVSDGTGQYRIEDLRPGTYTVRFTLAGFNTFKREGVELTGTFTATINAELKVGSLAETITVTGESPVVDVQNAKREMTLSNDVVKAIPTVRSYNAMVSVVPGVITNLNDVVTGTVTTQFPIHGGRNNEGRLTVDGLNIGNPPGGNQPPSYIADVGNAEEVSFTTSGGLGESETAGLVMNIVPKTGGNTIHGSVFFSGSGEKLQSDNFNDTLRSAGLVAPTPLTRVYDLNGAGGGPIKKDRVWYFVNARTQGSTRTIANVYYNLNAGDPTKWTYAPDTSRPAFQDRTSENVSGRVTWQVTTRNKIGAFWDEQANCRNCEGLTTGITDPPRVSPEARGVGATKPLRVAQVTWSSPVTSRLLLDAGFGGVYYGWGNFERNPNPTRDLIGVVEQCAAGCAANGGIPGLVYRSQDFGLNFAGSYSWRASASYVTGRRSLKIGYQGTLMIDDRTRTTNNQSLTYRFNNGTPNQLTQSISPWINNGRSGWYAFFAQDQWTVGHLTLQGALRFDHSRSWFPEQREGPSRFLPTGIVIPETQGVDSYKDVTPRVGVAYDLFGNGGDLCGAISNLNFGKYILTNNYDPALLTGWGVRSSDWSLGASIQQQILPRASIEVAYSRRWYHGFTLTDNLVVQASDYTPFSITAPLDPRLPGGGGYTISGLYDVAPSRFGQINNLITDSGKYGNWYQYFNGLDVTLNVRTRAGWTFQGGTSTGQTVADNCEVNANLPELNVNIGAGLVTSAVRASTLNNSATNPVSPYCHVGYGMKTQLRGLSAYTIPKIDVQFSGVFQSKVGALLGANYAVPSAVVAQSIGRPPAGNLPNVTVNLVAPGSMYGDRLNQLDFRIAKILRYGRTRTMIGVDLYNAMNSSAVLTYNNTFVPGGTWLQPVTVLTGRLTKISAELTF